MSDPFVVVGGDAAGLSAASKARREDPDREVIVFERGEWVSYAHCGMPYYVEGVVEDLTDLLALRPSDVEDRGIDLRRNHEVIDLDPDDRTVTVRAESGGFEQPYGDLLIATGARARRAPFDLGLTGAFTLHDMDDAAAIRAFLGDPETFDPEAVDEEFVDRDLVREYAALDPPETAAIVGGGYVGVEMAEVLSAHDLDVHLFQRSEHVLAPFGPAVGERVGDHLESRGVAVHTGLGVKGLDGDDRLEAVVCDGERIPADLAVVGVGVIPNVEFVDDVLELGRTGAIEADRYGRTSRDDVYAAGDCAETRHAVTGEATWIPLGLTANRAGRAVGATVAGDPTPVGEVAGTAVLKACDLTAGRTGIVDPEAAREAGFDPLTETIEANSRAGYYPEGGTVRVTLTVDRPTGRVLGGSLASEYGEGAVHRSHALVGAVTEGVAVDDLSNYDLAYAPPFNTTWDPVLTAAKVVNGKR